MSGGKSVANAALIGMGVITLAWHFRSVPQSPEAARPVTNAAYQAASSQAPSQRETVRSKLKFEIVRWKRGGFDTIAMLTFKLSNQSDLTVKDIELDCQFYASSGTALDSKKQVVYEEFKPNKSRTIKDFNMGFMHSQASKASCSVLDFVI